MARKIEQEWVVKDSGSTTIKQGATSIISSFGSIGGGATKLAAAFNPVTAAVVASVAAFTAVTKVAKESYDVFVKYEEQLNNVWTMLDVSNTEMEAFGKEVRSLPSALGSTTELLKGMYEILSAGVPKDNAVEFLTTAAKAGKAGMTDMKTAADGLTTVVNAYHLSFTKAQEVSDKMFTAVKAGKTTFDELAQSIGRVAPTASQLGVTTDALLASIAILTKSGIKTSEAASSLKAAFTNIIKPQKAAADMAEELGIQFDAAALKAKGMKQFMEDISIAADGDVAKMGKLFGSSEALNAMLILTAKEGGAQMTELLDQMAKSAGATQTAFEKIEGGAGAGMKELDATFEKIYITIGERLAPVVGDLVTRFNDWLEVSLKAKDSGLNVAIDLLGNSFKILGGLINIAIDVFNILSPLLLPLKGLFMLLNVALEAEAWWIGQLEKAFRALADFMTGGLSTVISKTADGMTAVGTAAKDAATGVGSAIKEAAVGYKESVKDMLGMNDELDQNTKNIIRGYNALFKQQREKREERFPTMSKKSIDEQMEYYAKSFKESIPEDHQVYIDFYGRGSSVLPLSEKIAELSGKLFGMIGDAESSDPKVTFDLKGPAGQSLTSALNTAESGFKSMFDSIVSGTFNAKNAFSSMASSILSTIANMLSSQAINSFVSLLGGAITGALGGGAGGLDPSAGYGWGRAKGGPVGAGKSYLVGERGPELFMPGSSGTIIPNNQLGGAGNNVTFQNNINIQNGGALTDPEEANKVFSSMAQLMKDQVRQVIHNEKRVGGMLNANTGRMA